MVGIATARASNVIGAGDYNMDRLIPYLLDSFSNNRIPQIRNPEAVRPWQYVLDVLYGYLLLAEKLYSSSEGLGRYNGAYNFGPREDGFVKVGTIVSMVSRGFENAPYEIVEGRGHIKRETKILKLDSTKARTILDWNIYKTLEESVAFTIDFVKKERQGIDAGKLSRKQVMDYLKEVR